MTFKKVDHMEIREIVKIHQDAFKGFFLNELGTMFLFTFYSTILSSKSGNIVGAYSDNKLVGFCVSTNLSRNYYKSLIISNIFSYSLLGLFLVIQKPKAIIRILRNLNKSPKYDLLNGEYSEILSLGVNKSFQNCGVGSKLLKETESILRNKNCKFISLTTDKHNNKETIDFYKKNGFAELYEFSVFPNRSMIRFIKSIHNLS